jgi:predicted 2-oxoglutarate/Fe(II)-dependent dioxygenase YbiX
MQHSEYIYTFDGILTPEECREYIAMTEAVGYEAAPISSGHGFAMRPDIRNNARVMLDDRSRARTLWQRLAELVPQRLSDRRAVGLNERFRFYRYDPGERFSLHRDGAFERRNGEKSLLTFMVYLNDGFAGGTTTFGDLEIVPVAGMALVFHHFLMHEGSAVTQGRKYVLRSDVMYSPPET